MDIKHSLSDTFEYEGIWWLPRNPDKQLPGKVSYNPSDGVHLKLFGTFENREDIRYEEPFEEKIILGLTIKGKQCTLLDNFRVKWSDPTPGIFTQDIQCNYALFGHHFINEEAIVFSSFGISYEHLEEWIGKTPFKIDYIKRKDHIRGYNINFEVPESIEVPINCKKGVLRIACAFYNDEDRFKSFGVSNEAFIVFRPDTRQNLDWYTKLFFDIERLLILLMGETTFSRKIQGYMQANQDDESTQTISIYRTPYSSAEFSGIYSFQMLMPLSKIDSSIQNIFETWLVKAETLRFTYDMFFAQNFKPDMYLESKFLNVMRALESFHRSTKHGKYLPKKDYDDIYSKMVASIPSGLRNELKQALNSKLKYGNEYSLRTRIKELFRDLNDQLKLLVTDNEKKFIGDIVDWRNDLTHYDIDSKDNKLDYHAISKATRKLRVFIIILLLKSLEIDEATIYERILIAQKWRRL